MDAIRNYLDKINAIAIQDTVLSVLDKDLMLEHTRRLYEAILELTPSAATELHDSEKQETPIPETVQPAVPEITIPEPELVPEPEPDRITEVRESLPPQEEITMLELEEEPAVPEAASTPAELYSSTITTFSVSGRDIRTYIGINDKYNFISELFSGNAEAYEEILNEINTFETQEDALFFLNNSGVTTLYQWDQQSFSVRIFHSVLSQFFAAR